MKIKYARVENNDPERNTCIIIRDENDIQYTVPLSEGNSEYREYLKWVAEGNTPEPADE